MMLSANFKFVAKGFVHPSPAKFAQQTAKTAGGAVKVGVVAEA